MARGKVQRPQKTKQEKNLLKQDTQKIYPKEKCLRLTGLIKLNGNMKIFLTEFTADDDQVYDGPRIYALCFEDAELAAEEMGVVCVGELTDLFVNRKTEKHTIH